MSIGIQLFSAIVIVGLVASIVIAAAPTNDLGEDKGDFAFNCSGDGNRYLESYSLGDVGISECGNFPPTPTGCVAGSYVTIRNDIYVCGEVSAPSTTENANLATCGTNQYLKYNATTGFSCVSLAPSRNCNDNEAVTYKGGKFECVIQGN